MPALGIQALALNTALEGGFFEAHGLSVTIETMGMPMDVMRAVRMELVDLAVVPIIQVVNSTNPPRPLVAIGAVGGATQLNVVLAGEIAAQLGLTAGSSLEERLAGLKGIKLAHPPGPLGVITAAGVARAAGLDPEQDLELVPVRGEDQPQALTDGTVDAFVGHHPYIEDVLTGGSAIMLLHLTGGELPELGAFPNQVFALTPDTIAGNEEELRAALAALGDAQRAINEDASVAARALAVAFPELVGPILNQGVSIYAPGVPETPIITEQAYEIALQAFGLSGTPYEQVIDLSLIEAN